MTLSIYETTFKQNQTLGCYKLFRNKFTKGVCNNVNVNFNVMDPTPFIQYAKVCSKSSTFNACSFTLSYFQVSVFKNNFKTLLASLEICVHDCV